MHLTLVELLLQITGKIDEIMEKVFVDQDRHISSHDIGKELNIDKFSTIWRRLDKNNSMF